MEIVGILAQSLAEYRIILVLQAPMSLGAAAMTAASDFPESRIAADASFAIRKNGWCSPKHTSSIH